MLSKVRLQIDEIDREIISLFEKRMKAVKEVIEIKNKYNLEILDQNREKQVLAKVISYLSNNELEEDVVLLYKSIMDISKKYQARLLIDKNK